MLHPETADDLLYDLDGSQQRAVTSPGRPLAILAPAGSGKTRVLTRRIAWRALTGEAEAGHVLALTFTRKAAGELQDRLARLGLRDGVAAGTFHGIAYAQLRSLWAGRDRPPPALVPRKGKLAGEALGEARTGRNLTAAALAGEIEWAKARLLGPEDYAEGAASARRRPPAPAEEVARAYRTYETLKSRHKLVDFDDLLKLCGDALLSDPAFAAAQRWRFRHLFVDEFQDVNPLQLRLLDAWRGDHLDLCVVGDPQQAIYAWNGADPSTLENFRDRYPTAEIVALERNYRSTPEILGAAAQVLRRAKLTPTAARATHPGGPAPRLTRCPTDLDEATTIARNVRDHRAPRHAWAEQAVLVRTHGQIARITEGLRAAGIPHKVRGGATLLDDPHVRQALDMLRWDDRPISTCLPDLDLQRAELPEADSQGLATLIDLARNHHQVDPQASATGFATWAVATLHAEGADGHHDAVVVATFHAAKGLEWPVVHLAGLEDGFVPVGHARTTAARAEEARLLYVAMTRAHRELSCTWAAQRTFHGRTVERKLCPWLRDLAEPGAPTRTGAPPPSTDWQARLAEQRQALEAARPVPSPALESVLAWREAAARTARVDPASIVDDRLLHAVVDAMPSNHEELIAVPGMAPLLAARLGDGLLAALHDVAPGDSG